MLDSREDEAHILDEIPTKNHESYLLTKLPDKVSLSESRKWLSDESTTMPDKMVVSPTQRGITIEEARFYSSADFFVSIYRVLFNTFVRLEGTGRPSR